jgi:DNA polymerase
MADWQNLKQECLACRQCHLRAGCRGVVFGEGNLSADLMLVGEGPGQVEDELGRPFVGAAGQLLNRIIQAINLRREDVYITNVVKCRPPYNRTPQKAEMDICGPWLRQEIEQVKPKIIVCLGAVAAKYLIDQNFKITRERGRWLKLGDINLMATYHPAALLRDPSKKRPVWEDFKQIRDLYFRLVQN